MYRKSLDGVRAFCVIFTIFNHIKTTPSYIIGNFGVDIFFSLSGFLITFLLFSEDEKHERIDLKSFYIRRAFRILPLYFLTIALYFIATRVPGAGKAGNAFFNSFAFLMTVNREYAPADGVFGHAWTLGVEEKFYILWPAALFAISYTGKTAIALLSCLIAAVALCVFSSQPDHVLRGYIGLSFGAATAAATLKLGSVKAFFSRGALAAYSIAGMAFFYLALLITHSFICNICIGACGAVLVGSLWYNENQITSKILSTPIISYFGRLTYSMYLTHVLVINIVMLALNKLKIAPQFLLVFAITYIGTAIFSSLLHAFIEVPLINMGRRLAKRNTYNQLVASDPNFPGAPVNDSADKPSGGRRNTSAIEEA